MKCPVHDEEYQLVAGQRGGSALSCPRCRQERQDCEAILRDRDIWITEEDIRTIRKLRYGH